MNKKAEKLFSLWWFFVLVLVGMAIVGAAFIYYSADFDVRKAESLILYNYISNCLLDAGEINRNFISDNFDIFKECNINEESIINSEIFYFKIILKKDEKPIKTLHFGNPSFDNECKISKGINPKKYPACVEKEEMVFYYSNGEKIYAKLYILTASNQGGNFIN